MATKKKSVKSGRKAQLKVRDLKPAKDAKGGRGGQRNQNVRSKLY
jgi:hypothetical protein